MGVFPGSGICSPRRIRCCLNLGLYTRAASGCMQSSGDITRCVVPLRQTVFEPEHHLSGGVGFDTIVGHCRAGDVAAQWLQPLAGGQHRDRQLQGSEIGTADVRSGSVLRVGTASEQSVEQRDHPVATLGQLYLASLPLGPAPAAEPIVS